jgi:hypothetical protein
MFDLHSSLLRSLVHRRSASSDDVKEDLQTTQETDMLSMLKAMIRRGHEFREDAKMAGISLRSAEKDKRTSIIRREAEKISITSMRGLLKEAVRYCNSKESKVTKDYIRTL